MVPQSLVRMSVRTGVLIGLAASLIFSAPGTFAANDVVRSTNSYADADSALAGQVQLWRPTFTAGLTKRRNIDVTAYGVGPARATFVGSTYGRRVPSFTMAQKGAATSWAAKPVQHPTERLVDTVAVRIGAPGGERLIRARVYANCGAGTEAATVGSGSPRRCERRDVARFGGAVALLARTTAGGVPQATDVRIDSTGLSYQQLVRIASGLRPVR
jgi:hypothetical protein